MSATPGWHLDPTGRHGERWWDGRQWTSHTRVPASAAPWPAPPAMQQQAAWGHASQPAPQPQHQQWPAQPAAQQQWHAQPAAQQQWHAQPAAQQQWHAQPAMQQPAWQHSMPSTPVAPRKRGRGVVLALSITAVLLVSATAGATGIAGVAHVASQLVSSRQDPVAPPTTPVSPTPTQPTPTQPTPVDPDPGTSEDPAEAFAQDFEPQLDADGTYMGAAAELTASFGVSLDYEFDTIYSVCGGGDPADDDGLVAAYCTATPTVIYVNADRPDFDALVRHDDFDDIIKHELSHHRIDEICGMSDPPIAGQLTEAVTSSYAVLYLGASAEALSTGIPPEYEMTAESDAIAQQVHAGVCS